jgi:predicted RNase H-like nuclease (RuvC/YqgF family)
MENAFELLEEKVHKAAELVKRLRRDNESLDQDLAKARGRLAEAEKRLAEADHPARGASGQGRELETLQREVKALRQERTEVRDRIVKLVEILDGLD